mgnify:CR=1 FL=1
MKGLNAIYQYLKTLKNTGFSFSISMAKMRILKRMAFEHKFDRSDSENIHSIERINNKMLYGYIRVSTGTQAMHGYSLDEQKQALMNAGVEEKRIFGDAGKTGTNFNRDGWINLTKAVR